MPNELSCFHMSVYSLQKGQKCSSVDQQLQDQLTRKAAIHKQALCIIHPLNFFTLLQWLGQVALYL
jgi:hypothetical protein